MTKKIPLINSKQEALISDDDFARVNEHRWSLQSRGYVRTWIGTKVVYLHRFIMGAQNGEEIDHKDLNKLNCQRDNLRFSTRSQNNANKNVSDRNTSGYKGVNWDKSRNKFLARIGINGVGKNLGRYETAEEAAQAYNNAAKELYGEFAKLNEI